MVAVGKYYTENGVLNKKGRKSLQKVTLRCFVFGREVPKMNQPMSQDVIVS